MADAILLMDEVSRRVYDRALLPRYGWHGDHKERDGTADYLPAIQQDRGEFFDLLRAIVAAGLASGRCLQLGLGEGGASHIIWRAVFDFVCSVDSSDRSFADLGRVWQAQAGHDRWIVSWTKDAVPLVGSGYDFLFIDAGHSYDDVSRDFHLFANLVRPGGIVAFHDALPRKRYPEIEVYRFIEKLCWAFDITVLGDEIGTAYFVKR